jgi:L-threonylcarbamoyladenylate synthase
LNKITKDINKASQILISGGIVAIPTETVYGLAANALDLNAVMSVFKAKERPTFNPLILHLKSTYEIQKYVRDIPKDIQKLIDRFSPGAITFLLEKSDLVDNLITAGSDYVAVRVPSHPIALELLKQLDFPLVAPSANKFGTVSPTSAIDVSNSLSFDIDLILDGGICDKGIESTIVGYEDGRVIIHRLGAITVEEIESTLNSKVIIRNQGSNRPKAPGQLKSHYAPKTKCVFGNIDELLVSIDDLDSVGFLLFDNYRTEISQEKQIVLSFNSSLEEATKNLYSSLRKIDHLNIKICLIEPLPNYGLGLAINDRLERASYHA